MIAPRVECKNNKHVNLQLKNIIQDGGEGVILRKKGSLYEHGRTTNLLKLKVYFLKNINCFYILSDHLFFEDGSWGQGSHGS